MEPIREDYYFDLSVEPWANYAAGGLFNANSGKTEASAWKCSNFVLHQQSAPRIDTPFWIIAKNYEQVCNVCWKEKLHGHGHIPDCEIDWPRVSYIDVKKGWPSVVPLKPRPGERTNWCLHFKSYEQGRESMQASSIGGFWFSEQFPGDLFIEVFRGCRDYLFPGGQFAEFTPIDPDMCMWVERLIDHTPDGWRFYRCNTECNTALADDWLENFKAAVPDEMMETRLRGSLATFEGVIYQAFHSGIHVAGDGVIDPIGRRNVEHYRGIDWGASEEHPFTCVWGYRDGMGDWFVYDEYWNNSQSAITADHIEEISERSKGWGWAPNMTPFYRETYADPSRPGEINAFNRAGIVVMPGANDVFKGIDCVRSLLKVSPATGKPRFYIHQRCKHLIEEMRKYRWRKGKKPASGAMNPAAGKPVPLKRDDDTCFIAGTMIHTPQGCVPIETLKPGDIITSHRGEAVVLDASETGTSPVVRLSFVDGRVIICTGNHKFALAGGGWREASRLYGCVVDSLEDYEWKSLHPKRGTERELKQSSMVAGRGGATRTQNRAVRVCTLGGLRESKGSFGHTGFMSKFGRTILDHRLGGWSFITRTKIQATTTSKILNCGRHPSTAISTKTTLTARELLPPHGTDQEKGVNGTVRRESSHGNYASELKKNASIAGSDTRQRTILPNSVAMPAGRRFVGWKARMMSSVVVPSAARPSQSTVTERRSAARKNVQPLCVGEIVETPTPEIVYNLATSDGTYFANGVLVSNCDAMRYLIYSTERGRGAVPGSGDVRTHAEPRHSIQARLRDRSGMRR